MTTIHYLTYISNISSRFKSSPSSSSGSEENIGLVRTARANTRDGAKAFAVEAKRATSDRMKTSFMVVVKDCTGLGVYVVSYTEFSLRSGVKVEVC